MLSKTVRLPPLATLQAFEAAVRHRSYTRAAEELHLTHGAISHHVAALETRLGVRLFVREKNRMRPTEQGQLLVVKVRQALGLLERGFAQPTGDARKRIVLSLMPPFASRWMVPRLSDFRTQLPDIDLTLDVRMAPAELGTEADCAVRFGPGGWPDVQQERLMREELFPVCAPGFREGLLPRTPAELRHCALLGNPWLPWEPWLHAAGLDFPEPPQSLMFTDSSVLLDAAAAGLGVAMARRVLVEGDLRSGRLLRLFDISVPDPYSYLFVWRADHPQLDTLHRIRAWLREQAAGSQLDI